MFQSLFHNDGFSFSTHTGSLPTQIPYTYVDLYSIVTLTLTPNSNTYTIQSIILSILFS